MSKWRARISTVGRISLLGVLCGALSAVTALCQQPKGPKAAAAGESVMKTSAATSDAELKAKILASDAWKQVGVEYQKWLSSQAIYTPADIQRINAQLDAQIRAMPAKDMQEFVSDWQAKLAVLNGKDFQQAQAWLGTYMSALTDGYRSKTLRDLGLTDVANMSAVQLEDAITRIRADRLSVQRSQAAFQQSQQQMVQMVQQANAAGQQAQQQTMALQNSGPQNIGLRSPYNPGGGAGPWNPPPLQGTGMKFFEQDVNGRPEVGYSLPF
jgi:hypothetical protein